LIEEEHLLICEIPLLARMLQAAFLPFYSWASIPGRKNDLVFKLLSVYPDLYPDAPTEGVRRILEDATGTSIPKGQELDLDPVESIRMGTTVATK
jgi:hypothetical protein